MHTSDASTVTTMSIMMTMDNELAVVISTLFQHKQSQLFTALDIACIDELVRVFSALKMMFVALNLQSLILLFQNHKTRDLPFIPCPDGGERLDILCKSPMYAMVHLVRIIIYGSGTL
jgi:hypothetical protein